jgi:hypothetical protein
VLYNLPSTTGEGDMLYRVFILAVVFAWSATANAQVVTGLTDPTYLAVVATNTGGVCAPPVWGRVKEYP